MSRRLWTYDETDTVICAYNDGKDMGVMVGLLPNRSRMAIQDKINDLLARSVLRYRASRKSVLRQVQDDSKLTRDVKKAADLGIPIERLNDYHLNKSKGFSRDEAVGIILRSVR